MLEQSEVKRDIIGAWGKTEEEENLLGKTFDIFKVEEDFLNNLVGNRQRWKAWFDNG